VCLSLPLTSKIRVTRFIHENKKHSKFFVFFIGSISKQWASSQDPDIVDSYGGGYSYFQQQDIDMRPTGSRKIEIPIEDLQDYSESSAFEQPLKPIQRTFQQNTYPSNQIYYPPPQQQRSYSPQINFGNQQIRK